MRSSNKSIKNDDVDLILLGRVESIRKSVPAHALRNFFKTILQTTFENPWKDLNNIEYASSNCCIT